MTKADLGELLERVERLEAAIERLRESVLPLERPAPVPVIHQPRGCICPPGAEAGCKGSVCPRRGLGARQNMFGG